MTCSHYTRIVCSLLLALVMLPALRGTALAHFTPVSSWRGNVWDNNLARVCINGSGSGCE